RASCGRCSAGRSAIGVRTPPQSSSRWRGVAERGRAARGRRAALRIVLRRASGGGVIAQAGTRYFGFVIGGSYPVAVAADWLTSVWDQNSGLYATTPAVSVIEETASGWLRELCALPARTSVGFVTGCQMANFTGLAAARHAVLERAGWNVEL